MGTPRVRRQSYQDSYTNVQRLLGNGVVQSENTSTLLASNASYCEDELNETDLFGSGYDVGGNFLLIKSEMNFPPVAQHAQVDAFGLRWTSDGPIMASPEVYWGPGWSDATIIANAQANAPVDSVATRIGLGATAINACRPAKAHADVSVSVIEMLREGIPQSLAKLATLEVEIGRYRDLEKKLSRYKRGGQELPSEFLEYQFGWLPLVADIRKASKAIAQSDRILEDLRRNSGKRMRRRYGFPATSTTSLYRQDGQGPWPHLNSYLVQQTGGRTITWKRTKKTWFSGEFVYTFPSEKRILPIQIAAGAQKLLGISLTPETLWNIAPWTWLTDWVANTGDVVANVSAIGTDSLMMRYGYLMQEATSVFRHEHLGVTIQGSNVRDATIVGEFTDSVKTRIGASPFGFGITNTELDARQIALLA